ncbi:MAG TPA: cyclic nucleotide-binding domain-containing protein [Candidatus Polarisedimenticolia bacterium]|nr:cyclic nucleotide-binding domain-containing protein [Candidatus Polarisedimenticolia bacterium]
MTTNPLDTVLRTHPFLHDLDPAHLRILVPCAEDRIFASGDFLCRVGEPAEQFFLLREGRVALEVHVPKREGVRFQTLHEGEVLGWSWLFPPYRWHLDARALKPVRAVALDARRVRRECERDHKFGYQILKRFAQVMGHRLKGTRLQIVELGHGGLKTEHRGDP